MSRDDYTRALDAACREYERLHAERAALDTRLAQVTESISTLNKLCGFVPTVPLGLTDACRMILRNAGTPMTATAVRDRLAAVGVNLDRYANALSAVHTVLKRMVEGGEASTPAQDETERVAYEFLRSGVVASRVCVPGTTRPRQAAVRRGQARRRRLKDHP
jgi:hypothetical protein